MNGKDIMVGLGYIDRRFVEEAERYHPKAHSFKRPLLIAAVIALALMLVGCGIAYAGGWFRDFFAGKSDTPLSEGQVSYINQNEQVINEGSAQNGWTVELRSAIHDGTTGYIIIGITAPEGVSLESNFAEGPYGRYEVDRITTGNDSMFQREEKEPRVLTFPREVFPDRWTYRWEEDGDGLSNTKNYVIQLHPNFESSTVDPFGPDASYSIHIRDIIRESEDEEYKQSLLDGKYAGQDAIMYTPEEIMLMHKAEVLAEGTWDFTVTFAQSQTGVELLTQPITVMAYAYRKGPPLNEFIHDTLRTYEPVTVTSFVLSPLSATITYECDASCRFAVLEEEHIYAVMKDGSQIELQDWGTGGHTYSVLDAASPIVPEEVDHILMADGLSIPVP